MFSYWEKQSLFHFDALVVGSGITGLSTAITLAERRPQWKIAILERGIIPAGASTRNAGFACIGSFTEILDDLGNMAEQRVVSLVKMRLDGLRLLRKRLGDERLGYHQNGSYELIADGQIHLLDGLEAINRLLRPVLLADAFSLSEGKRAAFGFDQTAASALIENHLEGELDAGQMIAALMDMAGRYGIRLFGGCKVSSLEERANGVEIKVKPALQDDPLVFRAAVVAVCTNAFTSELLSDVPLKPGRGQVLITEPVKNLPFKGVFHFDRGYYYFREIDGRVFFGGGRNLDFAGETTTEPALNARIQQDLEEKLRRVVLPGREVAIASRWAGIMAFGDEKYPYIKRQSSRIFVGVRLGGMGIAIGSEVGRMVAQEITGEH